jgi:malate synthase
LKLAAEFEPRRRQLLARLQGSGCVPLYNLMEDAATAEICRTQVWQWVKHGAKMNDGKTVTAGLVRELVRERGSRLYGEKSKAAAVMEDLMTSSDCPEFRTLASYDLLD